MLILNYARLMNPLAKITLPKNPFVWSEEHSIISNSVGVEDLFSKQFYHYLTGQRNSTSKLMQVLQLLLTFYFKKYTATFYHLVVLVNLCPCERRYPALKL